VPESSPALPLGLALARQVVVAVAAALLALILALLLNMSVQRSNTAPGIAHVFADGQIESEPPVALSPWSLTTRAQADCAQLQPVVSQQRVRLESTVARRVLRDRDGAATPCELLAARVANGDEARIVEVERRTGMFAAGSIVGLLLNVVDATSLRWFHIALIALGCIAVAAAGWRGDSRRAALPIAFGAVALWLAVPGSITLLPVTIVLVVLMALLARMPGAGWWRVRGIASAALAGAGLVVLDPSAASAAAGLAILLYGLPVRSWSGDGRALSGPVFSYILAVAFTWIGYALLAGIVGDRGGQDIVVSLIRSISDHPTANWAHDLSLVPERIARWLSDGPFGAPLALALALWTLPFALAIHATLRRVGAGAWPATLASLLPPLVWAAIYPGYLSRGAQDYVLLYAVIGGVALAGPVAALIELAHRLGQGLAARFRRAGDPSEEAVAGEEPVSGLGTAANG